MSWEADTYVRIAGTVTLPAMRMCLLRLWADKVHGVVFRCACVGYIAEFYTKPTEVRTNKRTEVVGVHCRVQRHILKYVCAFCYHLLGCFASVIGSYIIVHA